MVDRTEAHTLIDIKGGRIARDIFTDPEIYADELKNIFRKSWLFVGHESQIRRPGDFFLSKMGEESVILTRDRDGQVQVMLNSCRHRGMAVCRYDTGSTQSFFCPYHGWSYGLDGKLNHVTEHENEYQNGFNAEEWGLIKVAKLAIMHGLVFATWDPEAPSFDDYMGGAKLMLDHAFRSWNGEGEIEVLGTVQKWIVPSNWKIISENHAGDRLHGISHRSVELVGIGHDGKGGRRDAMRDLRQVAFSGGHAGVINFLKPEEAEAYYSASPATAAYFKTCLKRRVEVMGEQAYTWLGVGNIFPTISFHGNQPRTMLASHPRGPGETEMWRWFFVDKDAPEETKAYLRQYYNRYSGPAGMTEQDDMENWSYATSGSRGVTARNFPYNYQAGLGRERAEPQVPGAIGAPTNFSELTSRSLYERWAEVMNVDSEETT